MASFFIMMQKRLSAWSKRGRVNQKKIAGQPHNTEGPLEVDNNKFIKKPIRLIVCLSPEMNSVTCFLIPTQAKDLLF